MKQSKSFGRAFAESIRMELPYWVSMTVVLTVCAALDFAWLDTFFILLLGYIGIGACVVFVMLKQPSQQDPHRIDFLGALKNLYQAAWWPWYVWKRLARKG